MTIILPLSVTSFALPHSNFLDSWAVDPADDTGLRFYLVNCSLRTLTECGGKLTSKVDAAANRLRVRRTASGVAKLLYDLSVAPFMVATSPSGRTCAPCILIVVTRALVRSVLTAFTKSCWPLRARLATTSR